MQDYIERVVESNNAILLDSIMKCQSVFEKHKRALISVSGGADSDDMLDLCWRVSNGMPIDVRYVWFDTGVEFQATKRHLDYLEQRYGIEILRYKARKSIPTCCKEYGQPFLSKFVSENMERLQRHGFQWEDEPFDVLIRRYPKCTTSLKWWTNGWTSNDKPGYFDIGRFSHLKEFIVENPPWFRISNKCCQWAKKLVAKHANKELGIDLECIGVRRAEGGIRGALTSCFTSHDDRADTYRPLLWWSDADKVAYEQMFGIRHSDCYTVWGFDRTGCVGCPYNKFFAKELAVAEQYEPGLARAARHVFKDSYEYTIMYRDYQREHGTRQMSLDLRHARV